jgi:mycothiol synthase
VSAATTVSVRPFRAGDSDGVRSVLHASLERDGIPGFTVHDIGRQLERMPADPTGTLVALDDGRVVGVCTPRFDDLTVHPDARRRGHGRRLALAARDMAIARGDDRLDLHVPTTLPGSVAFAQALGMRYRSSLWQFELTAEAAAQVPPPAFANDLVVRPWDDAIDTDFVAWTAFMMAAFEGHPTTMTWTAAVVEHVHAGPSFDRQGILIVASREAPERPIAFTRIEVESEDDGILGEVGLIGVLPAWRGRGLGRELLRWAIGELRVRGSRRIVLAVEAANDRATRLYRAHGFEPIIEWPHWELPLD